MLDEFFKVAYAKSQEEEKRANLHNLLKKLPIEDLYKLASGEVTKQAFLEAEKSEEADKPKSWVEKFKDTPFFDQAVALEQEEIQLEMDDLQKRQDKKLEAKMDDNASTWELRDQLKLKRRLLELQATQAEVTGQDPNAVPEEVEAEGDQLADPDAVSTTPPVVPAQTALKAPGEGAVETPPEEKTSAAKMVSMAEVMGRNLARQDFQKEASQRSLLSAGDTAGRILTKTALSMTAVKGLGQGAMGFLKANPGAAAGTALGAAGGLAAGLQKDPQTGQRSIVKGVAGGVLGGAAGAAAGHGAQHFSKSMAHSGGNVGESLAATGRQLKYQAGQAGQAVKGALTSAPQAGAATLSAGPSTAAMAPTMMSGAMKPTVNMPAPGLQRPAAMPSKIPTGMVNGSAFQNPMAPPNPMAFAR